MSVLEDAPLSEEEAMKPDPMGESRNPLAIYLLCLCFISGALILVGMDTSRSIEDSLNPTLVLVWGGVLVFGSSLTLGGLFWQGDPRTGLVMKRVGLLSLAVAAVIYAGVIVWAFRVASIFPAGIVLGFGAACFLQYRKVSGRIRQIIRITDDR